MGSPAVEAAANSLIQATANKYILPALKELVKALKDSFQYGRGKLGLEALGNKTCLDLCKAIFEFFYTVLNGKAKASTASLQLNLASSALRHVVSAGVRTIKSSTVEYIVDSIIKFFHDEKGRMFAPLMKDVPEALRVLFEYQPHVERLSKKHWNAAVDFCIEFSYINPAVPEAELSNTCDTSVSSRGRTPFDSTDASGARASPHESRHRSKPVSDGFSRSTDHLISCLHALVKASNAPLLDKAESIVTVLLNFLQNRVGRNKTAVTALAAINAVLSRVVVQSLELTKHTIQRLLPVMAEMWSDPAIRDELLITLTYTEPFISSLLADQEAESAHLDVEALTEAMYSDYRSRKDITVRQYLEEDNLCFRHLGRANTDTHPLNTYVFSMATEHLPIEGLWATVSTVARFSSMLDKRRRVASSNREGNNGVMKKRVRVTRFFDEYLRHVAEPRSNAKRAALQVVAFLVQEEPVNADDLQSVLEKLTSCISDENAVHSVWALIGLAAAAFQKSATQPSLLPYWVSAWQSASRAVASVSVSRAACHLMDVLLRLGVVPFSAISETVQSMLLSIELSGPALLTETSSSLMVTVIREQIKENPTRFNSTAERALHWLLSKWTPSLLSDRAQASLNAPHCSARDVLRVFYACLDRPFDLPETSPFLVLGPIAQARMQGSHYRNLAQYLLLLDDKNECLAQTTTPTKTSNEIVTEHQPTQMEISILEYCQAEVERTKAHWKAHADLRLQGITSDVMRNVTNLCIIAAAVTTFGNPRDRRISALESSVDELNELFVGTLMKPQIAQFKIDVILESCVRSLPNISASIQLGPHVFKKAGVHLLSRHLPAALRERKELKQSFYAEEDGVEDVMDVDEDDPQTISSAGGSSDGDVPRHTIQAEYDIAALRASCLAYLHLISAVTDSDSQEQSHFSSGLVDYITSLPENELLHSRQFIRSLLESGVQPSLNDCLNLLERLSDALIDPRARDYNTSEVANGMVVEVMTGTTSVWDSNATDREAQDLYENAEALYAYYIQGMQNGGIRQSPALQNGIAVFLHGLLKHHPDFSQTHQAPSVRTSLFELLLRGEMTVKYQIAERLPLMFEDFVLSDHDKILHELDSSLPGEEGGLEGIAVRLLVLSKLASKWHTLLRSSMYRIFATAGSVEQASRHAQRCIQHLAQARGMANSQRLFQLFAPQIIYTWLDRGDRKFADIPFSIFDYGSLADLLRDVESEAVGQAMSRGLNDELDYLAEQLETSTSDLLVRNVGKAAAYTISWDTCKGSVRDKAQPSYSNMLKDLIGSQQYYDLIQKQFPLVLSCLFQTMDLEERIGKSLDKKPAFTPAAKTLMEMTNIGNSPPDLNTGIEPSFNAFYLPDQLERLCRRSGDDAVAFWSSSNYTFVMRTLLDRIHPALGPLYARSIIRKIRVLVALAGPVAYEGYPLQMTLQSLRPFLTDIHCAEDTVGIMQYLLQHGSKYLQEHLSFVTGIGLSILISVRVFTGSAQDSTTQQSQYIATMNTANRFHSWLTEYLKSHAEAIVSIERSSSIRAFKSITTAASLVHAEGNSFRGSEESKLLLEILNDGRSGRKLLNKTSREVALNLLCQNFEPAPTARDDVLGDDKDAADYASLVWESCQRGDVGDGYLSWTSRVLGRAYSAYGEVKQSTTQSRPWSLSTRTSKESSGKFSREAIVKEVIDLFYSDERSEVSLAEDAVRRLIVRLPTKPEYHEEMFNTIPTAIGSALALHISDESVPVLSTPSEGLEHAAAPTQDKSVAVWIRNLAGALCQVGAEDPILGALSGLLAGIEHMAERLFPYILHLVLLAEFDGERSVRGIISEAMMNWFRDSNASSTPYVRILIQSLLYLRSQPVPNEITRVDRDQWLEIDYLEASQAATICGMYRSALLFAETSSGQPVMKSSSRRSSILVSPPPLPTDLQLSIYKNLDEPDSFYGVDRGSSLSAVLDRLDYEGDGVKTLLYRGARLDSQMRRQNELESTDTRGTIKSLIMLNMNSITHSLLSNDQFRDVGEDAVESTLHTARKLGQWEIKAPKANHTEPSVLFKAFQGLHVAKNIDEAKETFDRQLLTTMSFLTGRTASSVPTNIRLRTLAALTEADEVVRASHPDHLLDIWERMRSREAWMQAGEFNDVRQLLSCRETLFNVLSTNTHLVDSLRTRTATLRNMEVEALVSSSSICRRHGALQESLASVTYLSDLVPKCKSVGLDIEATAQHEVANVLWEQGETEISIRMRQHLIDHARFDTQNIDLSLPVLLAKLGHHLAEARLAKPDGIIRDYLEPAIRELKGQEQGIGPGQVFHEYALFCDKQLQSPEAAEDMERIKTVMDRKLQEYHEFIKLSKTDKSKGMRDTYHRSARRAKNWYDLDHAEYERMREGREQFLRQCLENYLLSLFASDEYNNDALRVFSLWIEYADTDLANEAVKPYLGRVPSGKFALLMNQLSSRLQNESTPFQELLLGLVFRICLEHPYHGMHQIFAIQMKVSALTREDLVRAKDESARSRQKAATGLANALYNDQRSRPYWNSIYQSSEMYHNLAMFKGEKASTQHGRELPLDRFTESKDVASKVPKLNVPPATLQVEVRPNMDYTNLPKIHRFKSTMSIANGLSAPKVLTAIGTDGKPYKQLFKSGNDDLRQDAIMEQVFDQVSRLLKNHTATRIRNIGIRTYKVLPLSTRSGLMEFVQNTIPLHLWVMPAHEKYYPSDYKPDKCRKDIAACQQESIATRVKVWQKVAANFHPVMRYFLLERFEDPDEWFERRLAYSRSTAAISILGHVLGLGDRHCHNILLDEKSGEVVHIDLGVSFEAGRVLPVPEVVPFRLTRDLVDAMGYSKTEGVFRRCCEFTMDTLREERESIMTLLNVLRYDPLVNWSVTPTKAKRMQEGQDTNANNGTGRAQSVVPGGTPAPSGQAMLPEEVVHEGNKKKEQEEQAGEAGRALSIVEKKLSKTLSTKATVNELIQQATDEKNLAVLYMGWASYA